MLRPSMAGMAGSMAILRLRQCMKIKYTPPPPSLGAAKYAQQIFSRVGHTTTGACTCEAISKAHRPLRGTSHAQHPNRTNVEEGIQHTPSTKRRSGNDIFCLATKNAGHTRRRGGARRTLMPAILFIRHTGQPVPYMSPGTTNMKLQRHVVSTALPVRQIGRPLD